MVQPALFFEPGPFLGLSGPAVGPKGPKIRKKTGPDLSCDPPLRSAQVWGSSSKRPPALFFPCIPCPEKMVVAGPASMEAAHDASTTTADERRSNMLANCTRTTQQHVGILRSAPRGRGVAALCSEIHATPNQNGRRKACFKGSGTRCVKHNCRRTTQQYVA